MRLARVLGAIGRTMITAGVLILLFVAYQLWGTNLHTARQQSALENEFAARLDDVRRSGTSSTTSSTAPATTAAGDTTSTVATLPPSTVPSVEVAEGPGKPAGHITIPSIGLDYYFVEGVRVSDLKKGPGHYPDTPFPGQQGNAAIAGHRTTYGAPFSQLNQVAVGDKITVETVQGTFTYGVIDVEQDGDGYQIVGPGAVEVLDDFGDNRLTLTTCHPRYSARQRLIVVGVLEGTPLPASPSVASGVDRRSARQESDRGGDALGLSGEHVSKWPAILWGLLCAAIWLVAWLVGRRWRRWPAYLVGLPIFLVALFFFFENFSRLLPANY